MYNTKQVLYLGKFSIISPCFHAINIECGGRTILAVDYYRKKASPYMSYLALIGFK